MNPVALLRLLSRLEDAIARLEEENAALREQLEEEKVDASNPA